MMDEKKKLRTMIDWMTTLLPLVGVVLLCVVFVMFPEQSVIVLQTVRGFLGDECGIYYAVIGTGILTCSLYLAFSKYGEIKLGDIKKPEHSSFRWGVMIFTSTMAADILFYSLCEWALYANEPYIE